MWRKCFIRQADDKSPYREHGKFNPGIADNTNILDIFIALEQKPKTKNNILFDNFHSIV